MCAQVNVNIVSVRALNLHGASATLATLIVSAGFVHDVFGVTALIVGAAMAEVVTVTQLSVRVSVEVADCVRATQLLIVDRHLSVSTLLRWT